MKARDPELASTTGSEVLEPDDPVFALVAAPTVVGVTLGAVVVNPPAVVGTSLVEDASPVEAGLVAVGSVSPTTVVGSGTGGDGDYPGAGQPGGVPVLPSAS